MRTEKFTVQTGGAGLLVIENESARLIPLDRKNEWSLGRYDPTLPMAPDIPLASYLVSRRHGWFKNPGDQWYFQENPENKNGTYYNGVKLRRDGGRSGVALQNGDILRVDGDDLDQPNPDGVLLLFVTTPIAGPFRPFLLQGKAVCAIGRDKSCEICERAAYFSSRHAEIRRKNEKYYLSDCDSQAGTFLNGRRVAAPTVLRDKDIIGICDRRYFFLGDKLLYAADEQEKSAQKKSVPLLERPVLLKADIDTKWVKDRSGSGMKELIRNIHLEIRAGTLVALLGTAGSGKSTVVKSLNGMEPQGVQGSVIYRGTDLIKHFEQMKFFIGSVPQEKTVHDEFTPEKELRIAAKKRLSADTSKKEIEERVDQTLKLLGIYGVRGSRNSTLSGGEKTRVNIGIELVADRDLLFLDEPDQGLDPKYKHEIFQIMQKLAHENGKSVVSIIHDVSEIDLFDQVIMLVKSEGVGRLAFSGTPEEMRKKFGVQDIREVYRLLESDPEKYAI